MRLGILASAFDPIHCGHLWAMQQALDADVCDGILAAVHVNPTTENPRKRKPATTVDERLLLVRAIRYVESVAIYHTENELRLLIERERPAVLIVGDDNRDDPVTGAEFAPIFWAARRPDWSGTEFSRRIAEAYLKHQEAIRCGT